MFEGLLNHCGVLFCGSYQWEILLNQQTLSTNKGRARVKMVLMAPSLIQQAERLSFNVTYHICRLMDFALSTQPSKLSKIRLQPWSKPESNRMAGLGECHQNFAEGSLPWPSLVWSEAPPAVLDGKGNLEPFAILSMEKIMHHLGCPKIVFNGCMIFSINRSDTPVTLSLVIWFCFDVSCGIWCSMGDQMHPKVRSSNITSWSWTRAICLSHDADDPKDRLGNSTSSRSWDSYGALLLQTVQFINANGCSFSNYGHLIGSHGSALRSSSTWFCLCAGWMAANGNPGSHCKS